MPMIDEKIEEYAHRHTGAESGLLRAVEDRTRRTNYNNLDNFARAKNGFGRFITDLNLTEEWSLRNELYLVTHKLDWRNTEKTVWTPVTERVDRSSFFLIYRS